jgi:hypothetical protein
MILILQHTFYKITDGTAVFGRYITEKNGRVIIIFSGHRLRAYDDALTGDRLRLHLVVFTQRQKQMDLQFGHGLKPLSHAAIGPGTAQVLCLGKDIPVIAGYFYRDIERHTKVPALFLERRM